jgi:hypothetical protein
MIVREEQYYKVVTDVDQRRCRHKFNGSTAFADHVLISMLLVKAFMPHLKAPQPIQ